MKLQKLILKGLFCLSLGVVFASCDDNDKEPWEGTNATKGVYVLNAGSWGDSNANFSLYNPEDHSVEEDFFFKKNNFKLGDTAQDMLIYGSKTYVSVTESNIIYVLDNQGVVLGTIVPKNDAEKPLKPRSLAAHNGKIYTSLQEGYSVARIDTSSFKIEAYAQVEAYPEQMEVIGNKLYVANSGQGAGSTLSAIALNDFEAPTNTINVMLNPSNLASDSKGNLYVVSLGDYKNISSTLQKINEAGKQSVIGEASQIAVADNKVYIIYVDNKNWVTKDAVFSWYDINTGELHKERFVADKDNNGKAIDLSKASSISIDPVSKNFYISTSDYVSTGDMYVFSATGKFIHKFDTGGLNPMGAYFKR